MGKIATKLLFHDVFITLLPPFVSKLMEIAQRRHLSKHVRTLSFHSKLLDPQYLDYTKYESTIDFREPYHRWCKRLGYHPRAPGVYDEWLDLEKHTLPPVVLYRYHHDFRRFYIEQRAMLQQGGILDVLPQALVKLQNLVSIKPIILSHGSDKAPPNDLDCDRCFAWQEHTYDTSRDMEEHPVLILTTM